MDVHEKPLRVELAPPEAIVLRLAGILLLLLQKQAENDELLVKEEDATNSLAGSTRLTRGDPSAA